MKSIFLLSSFKFYKQTDISDLSHPPCRATFLINVHNQCPPSVDLHVGWNFALFFQKKRESINSKYLTKESKWGGPWCNGKVSRLQPRVHGFKLQKLRGL